jgi:hypothetical protein
MKSPRVSAGIFLFVAALAMNSTGTHAAPASIRAMEDMPAKDVFEYCLPLWKRWDDIGNLDTAEQQDVAARCFFYFGSALMNYCERSGMEDAMPLKKLILYWKGAIESDPETAAGPLKATLIAAIATSGLCEKPSQPPAKARQKRTG